MPATNQGVIVMSSNETKIDLDTEKLALDRAKLEFDKEKHARERWWHEDALVNQRLNWLLTSQALLGAGYGYLQQRLAALSSVSPPPDLKPLQQISAGAPIFAIMLCIIILVGLQSAVWAQRKLQADHPQFQLGVGRKTTFGGHLTSRVVAIIFVLGWSFAWFALP